MRRLAVHLMNRSIWVRYTAVGDGFTWYLDSGSITEFSDRDIAAIDRACRQDLAERRAEWCGQKLARQA